MLKLRLSVVPAALVVGLLTIGTGKALATIIGYEVTLTADRLGAPVVFGVSDPNSVFVGNLSIDDNRAFENVTDFEITIGNFTFSPTTTPFFIGSASLSATSEIDTLVFVACTLPVNEGCGVPSLFIVSDLEPPPAGMENWIAIEVGTNNILGNAASGTGGVSFVRIPAGPMNVSIDIKPGSFPNSVNLGSAGVIPVAILSSETFDALTVDEKTIFLASAGVKLAGSTAEFLCHEEDVNTDGLNDLVCQVETAEFMIEVGEDTAELTAELFDGTQIRGTDSVQIVPD